jgi:hypothetical protein
MSMNAAGIEDPTTYLFAKLDVSTMVKSKPAHRSIRAMEAMKDVGRNSIRDMQRLADLASSDDSRLEEVALDVSDAYGSLASEALNSVRTLLATHRKEWEAFLDVCGRESWVAEMANG